MRNKIAFMILCFAVGFYIYAAAACLSGNSTSEPDSLSIDNNNSFGCLSLPFSREVSGTFGEAPSGPPDGPGSPMKAEILTDKEASDYFIDLDSSTILINAYVDYLYEKGIIIDDGSRLFRPNDNLSKSEALNIFLRIYGDSVTTVVLAGETDTSFLTMEEFAIWIYDAEKINGMPSDMESDDVSFYEDADSISENAHKAVATLTKLGIFQADINGNFNPESFITRGNASLVFYKLTFLGGGPGGPDGKPGPPPPGRAAAGLRQKSLLSSFIMGDGKGSCGNSPFSGALCLSFSQNAKHYDCMEL
ncbi:MAG: S-layer homology domain-containing protein [Spirochaetales bacterium]|nr:S-layer homology domain-containing protein [Spirochaetales bacterium]